MATQWLGWMPERQNRGTDVGRQLLEMGMRSKHLKEEQKRLKEAQDFAEKKWEEEKAQEESRQGLMQQQITQRGEQHGADIQTKMTSDLFGHLAQSGMSSGEIMGFAQAFSSATGIEVPTAGVMKMRRGREAAEIREVEERRGGAPTRVSELGRLLGEGQITQDQYEQTLLQSPYDVSKSRVEAGIDARDVTRQQDIELRAAEHKRDRDLLILDRNYYSKQRARDRGLTPEEQAAHDKEEDKINEEFEEEKTRILGTGIPAPPSAGQGILSEQPTGGTGAKGLSMEELTNKILGKQK